MDLAYNPVILEYNHIFQPFKATVLGPHETSESDYPFMQHHIAKEWNHILWTSFQVLGLRKANCTTSRIKKLTFLTSNVRNPSGPGVHISPVHISPVHISPVPVRPDN